MAMLSSHFLGKTDTLCPQNVHSYLRQPPNPGKCPRIRVASAWADRLPGSGEVPAASRPAAHDRIGCLSHEWLAILPIGHLAGGAESVTTSDEIQYAATTARPMTQLDVLYEDNHLLVINKQAEIATMGTPEGPTIHSIAADYIKEKYNKPGNVYVGIVSRLDAMTTGVLVLARTSKAAGRLTTQFSGKSKQSGAAKIYLAAFEGQLDRPSGELEDYIRKNDHAKRSKIVGPEREGAKLARLRYMTVGQTDDETLVAIQLMTGRKHQIRVQFADRRNPVVGDRKYGARSVFPAGIALHSWRLRIEHPTRKEDMWFEAALPRSWKRFSRLLTPAKVDEIESAFEFEADGAS